MATTIERKSRLNVRLSEEMHERASKLADSFGIPVSTLAAFAIGKFVNEHESNLKIREEMLGSMSSEMISRFDSVLNSDS